MTQEIKAIAEKAIMYQDQTGRFLRMQYCDEETFTCLDEDTGNEYFIPYKIVDLEKVCFYKLEKIDTTKDVVIVEIGGNVVQSISSTKQVQVLILDADADEISFTLKFPNDVLNKTINNELVHVAEHNVEPDQEYCLDILKQISNEKNVK